ncbi:TIR domain-containing protein [Saccharopolyspora gloriosae]|uniref:TIR domain-containing protein n=1 Tax=Saccharopolyspora gloriosae TaxID=455344 RepID=UPI001FB67646|nr:TIR domain-containing protein [Saccharopolyspora gloriosae]
MNTRNTVRQWNSTSVQANEVDTVNVYGHGHRIPHELPRGIADFTGREDELDRLDGLLAAHPDHGTPILITGAAGAGKTELAVRWAQRNREAFPDGEIYLDLHGHGSKPPMHPENALAMALRSLGDHRNAEAPTLDERSKHYWTGLNGKKLLLLLDNARDAEQVRPLLPNDHTALVLLTGRDALTGLSGDVARIELAPHPRSITEDAATLDPPVIDPPVAVAPGELPDDLLYDVFVSHTAEDAEWADEFVDQLRRRELRVAHDVLLPGDQRGHTVGRAVMDSRHGLLVFSRAAMSDGWIREEYELLLGRSVATGQRFIPVVIDDVALPLFADTRNPSKFHGASTNEYRKKIDRLVLALKQSRTST